MPSTLQTFKNFDKLLAVTFIIIVIFIPLQELNVLKHASANEPLTDLGLSIEYSDGSRPPGCTIEVVTCDQFTLPDQYITVSAVYKISLAKEPAVRIKMQHCVDVKNSEVSKRMSFALAHSTAFQLIPGGDFPVGERYGYIERDRFCCFSIVLEMIKCNAV